MNNMCKHEKKYWMVFHTGLDPMPRIQCGACGIDVSEELREAEERGRLKQMSEKDWDNFVYSDDTREFGLKDRFSEGWGDN